MQIVVIEMISFVCFASRKGVGFLCKLLIAAAHFEGSNIFDEKTEQKIKRTQFLDYFKYKSAKRQTRSQMLFCYPFKFVLFVCTCVSLSGHHSLLLHCFITCANRNESVLLIDLGAHARSHFFRGF